MSSADEPTRWPGRWFRIDLSGPVEAEEQVLALLDRAGCRGAMQTPAGPKRLRITAWFDEKEAASSAREEVLAVEQVRAADEGVVEERDEGWLEASLARRAPLEVGGFLIVTSASEMDAFSSCRKVIELPLGRAFGTGEHETTRLCLELLDRSPRRSERVLDLGSGSGILAIAAAMRGAREVLALDNDAAVIDVARDNIALNNQSQVVRVTLGSWTELDPKESFDLVLANIHRSALVRAAPVLSRAIRADGAAIVSGFSEGDAAQVVAAWSRQGFGQSEIIVSGDWAALRLSREKE